MLDFYHASELLWAVAQELFGEGSPEAKAWVEPPLASTQTRRRGGRAEAVGGLADLMRRSG